MHRENLPLRCAKGFLRAQDASSSREDQGSPFPLPSFADSSRFYLTRHCERLHHARALITVSSYSRCGSESETMPAPACKYACPFFNTAQRSAMQESTFPLNPQLPIAPA